MKLSPQIYAKTLIDSATSDNLNKISQNFWHFLQKNKQYKDLPKVLEAIDEEYAKKNEMILVKIFSQKELDENEINKIREKIEKIYQKKPIFHFFKKPITGIIAKADDKIIDLSVENKINRLKKTLQD